jgi:lipopolysaccharide biosynthesis glycosyltransferase
LIRTQKEFPYVTVLSSVARPRDFWPWVEWKQLPGISKRNMTVLESYGIRETHRVNRSAFLKFEIPQIFNESNRVLYLDVDTLVTGDLSELFERDFGPVAFGMVEDFYSGIRPNLQFRTENKIKTYFHAGVVLFFPSRC